MKQNRIKKFLKRIKWVFIFSILSSILSISILAVLWGIDRNRNGFYRDLENEYKRFFPEADTTFENNFILSTNAKDFTIYTEDKGQPLNNSNNFGNLLTPIKLKEIQMNTSKLFWFRSNTYIEISNIGEPCSISILNRTNIRHFCKCA